MKGLILDKGETYFTHLKKVFLAINNVQNNYNWLITDHMCYPQIKEYAELFFNEYFWISGEKLTEMINKEDFQWIWAVLSGFKKDIPKEEVLKYNFPEADGYTGFWRNPISIQHTLADIEIVPWDSSLVLFISKDEDIVDNFKKGFPLAEDLEKYNELYSK